MTDTTADPDAPTHATLFADTIFRYLDLMLDGLHDAQHEILDGNPEVKALDGPRLKEAMETGETFTLSADLLVQWGAARSINGACIELNALHDVLRIFLSIKEATELDMDLEALAKRVAAEGKDE